VIEKLKEGRTISCKDSQAALNLQPSDLCSNAFRSPPDSEDIFSLLFYGSISIETLENDSLTPKYLLVESNGY